MEQQIKDITIKTLTANSLKLLEQLPVGIIIFDKNFIIQYINQNLLRFGVTQQYDSTEYLHKDLKKIKIFDSISINKELKTLLNGESFEKELTRYKTLKNEEIPISIKGVPILQDKVFVGGILLIEDFKIAFKDVNKTFYSCGGFSDFISKIYDQYLIVDSAGKIIYRQKEPDPNNELPINYNNTDFRTIFGQSSSGSFSYYLDQVFANQKNISEIIPLKIDGKNYKIELSLIPLNMIIGKNKVIIALLKNITDKTDEYISKKEALELKKYSIITETIVDAVFGVNLNGSVNFWNKGAEKIYGYSRSEVFGKFIGKILPPINEKYFEKLKLELFKNNIWESELKIIVVKADKVEFISIRMGLLKSEEETSIIILSSIITERAKLERELRQSEERFRNIVINTQEYICTFDTNGKITYVNPFFLKTFRYAEDELLNMSLSDLIDDEFIINNKFDLKKIQKQKIRSFELKLKKKNGETVFVLANIAPVVELKGKPKYYNAVFVDITGKKQSEKDLLLIKSVFEASLDGIVVIENRKIILANNHFAAMFGLDELSGIIGTDPLDYVSDNEISKVAKIIQKLERGGERSARFEFKAKRQNQTMFYVENSIASYQINDTTFLVSVLRDVSQKRKAQTALEESEERYRSITENIDGFMWTSELVDNKLQTVFYTESVKKIIGFKSKEFLNDKKLWLKIIHPNDRKNVISKLKQLYSDPAEKFEELEYRVVNKNGNLLWIRNKINIIRNEKGEIQKVFGLVNDITIEKRAEEGLKKSANELKTLNDTKDRFISIISHDLRTPFSSILGFTDILLNERNLSEEKRIQFISFIQESSKNMLSLVNSLLDWTRLQTGRMKFEPQRINARFVVTSAIEMLSGTALKKNISLHSKINSNIFVNADENLLLQVFNNLISNAIKFTKSAGSIIIDAVPVLEKRSVRFSVKDTGVGIDTQNINKLFRVDTKFTLEGTLGEKGSGLGLSLCREIIEKHGGTIWVESEIGAGTEFIFTIPTSSTNILLVDDAKTDRLLYKKLLKSFVPNYNIVEAANGKEAYDIVKSSPPALIITDHLMPVMSGIDLVKQIDLDDKIKIKPPVIVLSSDLNAGIIQNYKDIGLEYIFPKPVGLDKFKHAIDESLKKIILG